MTTDSEPRIVTPQEAQEWTDSSMGLLFVDSAERVLRLDRLTLTVATEPERIAAAERAAVVKALRSVSTRGLNPRNVADAIENGADYA